MKILITGYTIDPAAGSEPRMAWHWIEGAAQNGHQVYVLTPPVSAQRVIDKCLSAGISNVIVHAVSEPGLPRLAKGEFGMYWRYIRWQKKVSDYAKDNGLDSCDLAHHTSWGNIGLGTGLASLRIPYVFGPAGGGTNAKPFTKVFFGKSWKREQVRSLIVGLLGRFPLLRKGVRKAAIVLVTNEATLRLAEKLGAEKKQVFLADGISESDVLESRRIPHNQEILWVARFMPRKGANLAIYAFAALLKRRPYARLTMVGDGPTFQETKALADELGILDQINFTGRIPWDEVQGLYADARCFLFSSLRDSFGAQVLEAAAKGLPVVAINGSGTSEWMRPPGARFAEPASSEQLIQSLVAHIERFLTMSDSEWHEASDSALHFARSHTWSVKYDKMNQIYKAILDEENLKVASI